MRTHTELVRLAEARPAIVDFSEHVVDAAEEDLILGGILSSGYLTTEPTDYPLITRTYRQSRLALCGIAAAVALVLLLVGTGSLAREGVHSQSTTSAPSRGRSSSLQSTGPTVQLAGYKFTLPVGFKTVDSPCAPMPPSIPLEGNDPFAAAGSADGGCIEVGLTAGTITGDPQPVEVGPYQGFLTSDGTTDVTLYVEMPTAAGKQYLMLTATGLSSSQIIAIAKAGLPSSIAPVPPCVSACG
jgi:hypothetical protein